MTRRTVLFAVLTLLAPRAARAADVVLRAKAAPTGPIIHLGDVADVSGIEASAAEVLAATPLMAAPAPGMRQALRVAQLRDRLAASGVNTRELRFAGSDVVTILGAEPVAENERDLRGTSGGSSSQSTADRIFRAIVQYLRAQSGHDIWEVRLALDRDGQRVELERARVTKVRLEPDVKWPRRAAET